MEKQNLHIFNTQNNLQFLIGLGGQHETKVCDYFLLFSTFRHPIPVDHIAHIAQEDAAVLLALLSSQAWAEKMGD